jgi:general secretion pathway protein D
VRGTTPLLRHLALGICAVATVLLAACATTSTLREAQRAEAADDFDLAVAQYTRLVREQPENTEARVGLDRARLRASQQHLGRGRRLFSQGRYDESVAELQIAFELNPTDAIVEADLRAARAAQRARLTSPEGGPTTLESLLTRTRNLPPAGLDLPELQLPATIETGALTTSRQMYLLLGKLGSLSVVFDPTFRESPAEVSLRDMSLREGLDAVAGVSQTFYKVTGPKTITVIPDTPGKRREYIDEHVRTFYVSNLDMKEVVDLLRVAGDVRKLQATSTNTLTIADTPERLDTVAKILAAIDKARPEVIINVEILEVDRTNLREYGLQFATAGSPGIDGVAGIGTDQTLRSLRNLTQADVLISGVPALYYRLLKTDTNTRTLANPHLRTVDSTLAQAKFGERVPIPTSRVVPLFQGGADQQVIENVAYENIGVNIDITPRVHANNDVTLQVKVSLSSVSGTGFSGYPTFGNREILTTLRLRDGETNIMAGLIRDNERTVASGIPGFSDLPVIGRLFARNKRETQETDIVLTLTPHIVRVLDLTEEDLRPFRIPRDGSGGLPVELTPLVPPPPRDGGRGGGGPLR